MGDFAGCLMVALILGMILDHCLTSIANAILRVARALEERNETKP